MKKISGETRLLLIMGLIVLAGGGYLAFSQSGPPGPNPNSTPEPPEATPRPMDSATFEGLLQSSPHRKAPKGSNGSPEIAIIEFGDVECSSCRYSYQKVAKDFAEKIPVEFAFRHFPLPNHQFAKPCAQALEAAAKQGKFWPLYASLFEEETPLLDISYIEQRARKVGLNMDQFVKDSQNPETAKLVDADEQIAHGLIVLRTPTFFILNRKAKKVDVAIGGKQLIEKLQGIPGVPSPPPSPTTNTK